MECVELRNNVEFSGVCVTLKLSVILIFCLVRVVFHYLPRCMCATVKCNCVFTHVFPYILHIFLL